MRAVVLGAGGQLGSELTAELERRGVSVLAASRRSLDITIPEAVEALISRHRPDWVFNTAAYNQVDLAEREPEKAMRVNGLAVRGVAVACQKIGAALLHYSTDHVFDGLKQEPYTEADPPAPPSAYGVSKLAGEHFARAYAERAYVVRVAGVFGPAGRYTNRGNFVELVLHKAAAGEPLRVVEDYFATPTPAAALAVRSIDLLEKAPPELYHLGGDKSLSWYEWGCRILRAAGLEADIQPTNHREYVTAARRPRFASLSNARAESCGIAAMPQLDDALRDYLERREQAPAPDAGV